MGWVGECSPKAAWISTNGMPINEGLRSKTLGGMKWSRLSAVSCPERSEGRGALSDEEVVRWHLL